MTQYSLCCSDCLSLIYCLTQGVQSKADMAGNSRFLAQTAVAPPLPIARKSTIRQIPASLSPGEGGLVEMGDACGLAQQRDFAELIEHGGGRGKDPVAKRRQRRRQDGVVAGAGLQMGDAGIEKVGERDKIHLVDFPRVRDQSAGIAAPDHDRRMRKPERVG